MVEMEDKTYLLNELKELRQKIKDLTEERNALSVENAKLKSHNQTLSLEVKPKEDSLKTEPKIEKSAPKSPEENESKPSCSNKENYGPHKSTSDDHSQNQEKNRIDLSEDPTKPDQPSIRILPENAANHPLPKTQFKRYLEEPMMPSKKFASSKIDAQAIEVIEKKILCPNFKKSDSHRSSDNLSYCQHALTRAKKKYLTELLEEFNDHFLPTINPLPGNDICQVYPLLKTHYEHFLEEPMTPPKKYCSLEEILPKEYVELERTVQKDGHSMIKPIENQAFLKQIYSLGRNGNLKTKRPVDFDLELCQPLVRRKRLSLENFLRAVKHHFNYKNVPTLFQNHFELYGKGELQGGSYRNLEPDKDASKFLSKFLRLCKMQENTILRQANRLAQRKAKKAERAERRKKKEEVKIARKAERKKLAVEAAELLNRSTIVIESKLRETLEHLLRQIEQDPRVILPNASRKSFSFQDEYRAHLAEGTRTADYRRNISSSLRPNLPLSANLLREFNEVTCSPGFQHFLRKRKQLPVFKMREELLSTIERNQVVVICGDTGSGKTTQIPQFVLDDYLWKNRGAECHIICTQPRRISAISVAERVAKERVESVGNSVGYKVRLDSMPPRKEGSILFCTTGMFLQKMKNDKFLTTVSHVFIDEVHERDVETDFLLIVLKDLIRIRRNLKVALLSASMNAELFSKYFDNCPIISIAGSTFPVEKLMLEDIIETIKYEPLSGIPSSLCKPSKRDKLAPEEAAKMKEFLDKMKTKYSETTIRIMSSWDERDINVDLLLKLIIYITQNKPVGGILVFLPGWADIIKVNNKLKGHDAFNSSRCWIVPLHSLLSNIDQRKIFDTPPPGTWKIILATNIAETSITIDDVVYVIDTGKVKLTNYDADNDHSTLGSQWICKANAVQRRGRAGRVQPGICYHLFSSAREELMTTYMVPEMLRTRLESLILQLKILNLGQVEPFLSKAIEAPSQQTIKNSLEILRTLNAMDSEENLTPLGYHLARLPLEPQIGKMILFAAMFSCLDPILTLAAFLSFKDAFVMVAGMESQIDQKRKEIAGNAKSDHIMLINVYDAWEDARRRGTDHSFCKEFFLSSTTLWMIYELRKQFGQYLERISFIDDTDIKSPHLNQNSNNLHLVNAIICAGLYPNVAKIVTYPPKPNGKSKPPSVTIKSGQEVQIHRKSVNKGEDEFPSQWLVYYSKIKLDYNIFLLDTSCVNPYALLFFGGNIKCDKETVTIDDWIVFNCQEETSSLIMKLRQNLDELLAYKASNPGVTQWRYEGKLLSPIIDLITTSNSFTLASSHEEKQAEIPPEEPLEESPEEKSNDEDDEDGDEFKMDYEMVDDDPLQDSEELL